MKFCIRENILDYDVGRACKRLLDAGASIWMDHYDGDKSNGNVVCFAGVSEERADLALNFKTFHKKTIVFEKLTWHLPKFWTLIGFIGGQNVITYIKARTKEEAIANAEASRTGLDVIAIIPGQQSKAEVVHAQT